MDDSPQFNPFRETDRRLRDVLEGLYATSNLFSVEELIEKIFGCIEIEFSFLIYVREKRWFGPKSLIEKSANLKFNFLSFEIFNGSIKRFETLGSLEDRESELIESNYILFDKPLCRILYNTSESEDLERILNLLSRIIVAFYRNCGSYDHFRESVSTRYIKEFYLENANPSSRNLIDYIERRSELKCTIWHQKDEMYFRQPNALPRQLLRSFPGTGSAFPKFFSDFEFVKSLVASVLRKNQTHGRTSDAQKHFVVKTIVNFQPASPRADSFSSRTQATAVAIYHDNGTHPLSLDGVFHANNLIEHYIMRSTEALTANYIVNADEQCLNNETIVSEYPRNTRLELFSIISETLKTVIESAIKITRADHIRFWLFDPFSKTFILISSARENDTDSTDDFIFESWELSDDHIVERTMSEQKTISLNHPDWVESEIAITENYRDALNRDEKLSELHSALNERNNTVDSSEGKGAAFAIPVARGSSLAGVLEVTAAEVGRLDLEATQFHRLSKICGDVVRRLELANDRGWMIRMSFIHAARHRIEELLRDLKDEAQETAGELLELIQSGHRANISTTPEDSDRDFEHAIGRIRSSLEGHAQTEGIDAWVATFVALRDSCGLSTLACNTVADIVETLISNAVHSTFQLDQLSLSHSEKQNGASELTLCYAPTDVMLSIEKLERITVSPIPDARSPTFHYGLFLLAAQLRMIGGSASVRWPLIDDGLGNAEFGLIFTQPTS